jgi:hypothetical protein
MNLNDYLIEHYDIDWATLLTDWHWLLPPEFNVWLMNKFGDLILITNDDAIHFFDVGNGTLERIADNRDDYCRKADLDDNGYYWLKIPLIDQLIMAGKQLDKGRCYSYLTLPILGGSYSVENTITRSLTEHYGVCASIHHQIKDLPNGTKVKLNVINLPKKD